MGRRISALVTAGILGVGLLAACGDDAAEPPMTEPTPTEEPMSDAPAAPDDPAGDTEISTADSELGTILVDQDGMTLYLFTNDSPGESVCVDDCLVAWPILEGEPAAGDGVDAELVGSIVREDGTVQATYADWPLYYFAQDTAPGDVTGQSANDVWFVVAPDGEMVTAAPGTATGSGTGY